jgi:hypothetical protein
MIANLILVMLTVILMVALVYAGVLIAIVAGLILKALYFLLWIVPVIAWQSLTGPKK